MRELHREALSDLTADRLRELFHYDPDTGVFTRRVRASNAMPGAVAGTVAKNGYVIFSVDDRLYLAHRLAWLWMTGEWPAHEIDHVNMDRADNRWMNLREATPTENRWNMRKRADNTTGYTGVVYHKGNGRRKRYMASYRHGGKDNFLGFYHTAEEASAAYQHAIKFRLPFLEATNDGSFH